MTDFSFTKTERKAAISLAMVYGLRMFGLFLVLPVLAVYSVDYPGYSHAAVGLAIGIYGLTQSVFQIPLGYASDRLGRKPVIIFGLLLFVLGSWVASSASTMNGLILGRALQGCGAIASALMALAADVTREQRRSKIMAVLGMSIGISFVLALIAGPFLAANYQLSGLFFITGILAFLAIFVVIALVPNIKQQVHQRDVLPALGEIKRILSNRQLVRLDFGIFTLHFLLSASFVQLPMLLIQLGIAKEHHAWVYLPVMVVAFLGMIPGIIIAEKKHQHTKVMLGALILLLTAQVAWYFENSQWLVISGLLFFFMGFNLLEAMLPSMISRFAPVAGKGTAMGVYSTSQFMGSFLGGVSAGILGSYFGGHSIFIAGATIVVVWMWFHRGQNNPPEQANLSIELEDHNHVDSKMVSSLLKQPGITEVLVIEAENRLYLRFDSSKIDSDRAKQYFETEYNLATNTN